MNVLNAQSWTAIDLPLIAGITDVGFDETTSVLLVVTHAGRGVFDLRNGNTLARDDQIVTNEERDDSQHLVQGVGPISDKWIRVSGLWGGSLTKTTEGYSLREHAPGVFELVSEAEVTRLPDCATDIRAAGFSEDGRVLILAYSGSLYVWRRANHAA